MSAFSFFLGWTVIFVTFWAFTKYEGTRTIIYYTVWLTFIMSVVVHYEEIQNIIAGAGLPNPGNIQSGENRATAPVPGQLNDRQSIRV